MPYLSTSQDFLKQSSLLLEAYPDTARITTKYSYPKKKPSTKSSLSQTTSSQQSKTPAASADPASKDTSAAPQPATLTLKTFHPESGICLKYRTNKAAEVGRLVAGLGKLAAGAPVEDVSSVAASGGGGVTETGEGAAGTPGAGDVELAEASTPGTSTPPAGAASAGGGTGVSKGGKGKKKGGKGKR